MLPEARADGSFPKWWAFYMALKELLKTRDMRRARAVYYIWTAPLLQLLEKR